MVAPSLINRNSIRREIRWMVLPIIVESIFALSGNLIFIALLGRIDRVGLSSITHVAAHGISIIITGLVWNLLKGISIGATISISQASGHGDRARIQQIGLHTASLLLVLGCLSSVLIFIFAEPIVAFYRPDAETLRLAVTYIKICCFGFPFLALIHTSTGVLLGIGNTKAPMIFSAILNVAYIMIGLPFIFGWVGEPAGVIGSGYSLVTGQIIVATTGMLTLFRKRGLLHGALHHVKLSLRTMMTVVRLGLPTSLENIFWLLGAMVIGRIMLGFGDLPYTASQIGLQTETIAILPAMSFGIVAMTCCGRAIGVKNGALGEAYVNQIKKTALPIIVAGMALLLIFPVVLLRLMSNNAEVISLASIYLRLMGLCLPALSLGQIYLGALKSGGHTRTPMLIALGGIWFIRVPLSIFVATFENATIVCLWYIVVLDLFIRFLITYIVYRKARLFVRLDA